MIKNILLLFVLLGISIGPAVGHGQDVNGLQVVEASYDRDDGSDSYGKVSMVLVDKNNQKRQRILEMYTKDYGPLIKNYLVFHSPADIENTAFLSWEVENNDDVQYLYLPALGRSRRIVSSQKNLKFVNTDFTYEDMRRRRPDKDTHTLIRRERYGQWDCYVIESIPKDDSQYGKKISWIDTQSLVVVRTEFYDKKGNKSKVFTVLRLEKEQDIWTPKETVMEDIRDGHRTVMTTMEVNYNQGLSDEMFSVRKLESK